MLELFIWILAIAVTLPVILATAALVRMGNKTTQTSTNRSINMASRASKHV